MLTTSVIAQENQTTPSMYIVDNYFPETTESKDGLSKEETRKVINDKFTKIYEKTIEHKLYSRCEKLPIILKQISQIFIFIVLLHPFFIFETMRLRSLKREVKEITPIGHGIIDNKKLSSILEELDDEDQIKLISKMNFEQLGVARTVLGNRKLFCILQDGNLNSLAHRQWEFITSLHIHTRSSSASERTALTISRLKGEEFGKLCKEDPTFKQHAFKESGLSRSELLSVVYERTKKEKEKEEDQFELKIQLKDTTNETIMVPKRVLRENSHFFEALFEMKDEDLKEMGSIIVEDLEAFKEMVSFLNSDTAQDLTDEKMKRILIVAFKHMNVFADKLEACFTNEELSKMAEALPELQVYLRQRQISSVKPKIKVEELESRAADCITKIRTKQAHDWKPLIKIAE